MCRVDVSKSFLSSRKKKKTENKTNSKIDNVLIILHHLTKLHASMEKVKNALKKYESLRNFLMHCQEFKCVENAFYSSAVVTRASLPCEQSLLRSS